MVSLVCFYGYTVHSNLCRVREDFLVNKNFFRLYLLVAKPMSLTMYTNKYEYINIACHIYAPLKVNNAF